MRQNYRKSIDEYGVKHSAEWYAFSVIVSIMAALAIYNPESTIAYFKIIVLSFIGYLIIHFIRMIK